MTAYEEYKRRLAVHAPRGASGFIRVLPPAAAHVTARPWGRAAVGLHVAVRARRLSQQLILCDRHQQMAVP
jgi:hypothetical protein|eukprot:COSAG06_NODE_1153_length_10481_cov_1445.985070_6_plen_71_part_00